VSRGLGFKWFVWLGLWVVIVKLHLGRGSRFGLECGGYGDLLKLGLPEEVPGGVAPGRLGRAFSPWLCGGAGTWGFAPG